MPVTVKEVVPPSHIVLLAIGFTIGDSSMVTVNEQVLVFPEASVAVNITVVVPVGNVLPLGIEPTIEATEQLSVAPAVANATI